MSNITEQEFIDIGSRMCQELQDIITEAENAGCKNPFPNTKELIEDWEKIYAKADTWKNDISSSGDIAGLANL